MFNKKKLNQKQARWTCQHNPQLDILTCLWIEPTFQKEGILAMYNNLAKHVLDNANGLSFTSTT